jgi:hypothetical protein
MTMEIDSLHAPKAETFPLDALTVHDVLNAIKRIRPDAHSSAMILAVLAENNSIEDSTALAAIREAYDACDTLAGHEDALAYEEKDEQYWGDHGA